MKKSPSVHIVILGGGFGGAYTIKYLHRYFKHDPKIKISLINKYNYFLFTPLLHEVATGSLSPDDIVEPLRKVIGCCLHDFYHEEVTKINTTQQTITLQSQTKIKYDYLVIALGSQTNFYNITGAPQNSFTLKTLKDAILLKNHCIEMIEKASINKKKQEREKLLNFTIIGGGPTGVELASELEDFLHREIKELYSSSLISQIKINLLQKNSELVPHFPQKFRKTSKDILEKNNIKVLLNTTVSEITPTYIKTKKGQKIFTYTPIWVAGVHPSDVVCNTAKEIDINKNQIEVNQYLLAKNHTNIFALGDNAYFVDSKTNKQLPPLAQVATKQAKVVAQNLYNKINNKSLTTFTYRKTGLLISIGKWYAIAQIGPLFFSGKFAWWLWRTIYLSKLLSWQKKLKIAVDWTVDIFSNRDISEY